MIQAVVDEGTMVLGAQGSTPILAAETLLLIGTVYREIKKKSDFNAEAFKHCITEAVKDNVPFASDEEVAKDFKEKIMKSLREADNGED